MSPMASCASSSALLSSLAAVSSWEIPALSSFESTALLIASEALTICSPAACMLSAAALSSSEILSLSGTVPEAALSAAAACTAALPSSTEAAENSSSPFWISSASMEPAIFCNAALILLSAFVTSCMLSPRSVMPSERFLKSFPFTHSSSLSQASPILESAVAMFLTSPLALFSAFIMSFTAASTLSVSPIAAAILSAAALMSSSAPDISSIAPLRVSMPSLPSSRAACISSEEAVIWSNTSSRELLNWLSRSRPSRNPSSAGSTPSSASSTRADISFTPSVQPL